MMLHTLFIIAVVTLARSAAPAPSPQQSSLEGTWVVESIDNIEVLPDSQVTIQLQSQSVSGLAPCNSYRGALTVDGTSLTVQDLLRTMKACDGPRMSEEQDFFMVLGAVVRFELNGNGTLRLFTADARRITARRK